MILRRISLDIPACEVAFEVNRSGCSNSLRLNVGKKTMLAVQFAWYNFYIDFNN